MRSERYKFVFAFWLSNRCRSIQCTLVRLCGRATIWPLPPPPPPPPPLHRTAVGSGIPLSPTLFMYDLSVYNCNSYWGAAIANIWLLSVRLLLIASISITIDISPLIELECFESNRYLFSSNSRFRTCAPLPVTRLLALLVTCVCSGCGCYCNCFCNCN